MLKLFTKFVAIIESLVSVVIPFASPSLTPVEQSPTPSSVIIPATPTPISSPASQSVKTSSATPNPTDLLSNLVDQLNQLKQEIASYTPEPSPTPYVIYVPQKEVIKEIVYLTPAPTPVPTPVSVPILTPTPTPILTPAPNPEEFLYNSISYANPYYTLNLYNRTKTIQTAKQINFEIWKPINRQLTSDEFLIQEYRGGTFFKNWYMRVSDFEISKELTSEYTGYIIKFPVFIEINPNETRYLQLYPPIPPVLEGSGAGFGFRFASPSLFPNGPIELKSGIKPSVYR